VSDRVHVVCFGNRWHGDDGFGLAVLRHLEARAPLPAHVAAYDAGTAGLDALPRLEGCARAVIVDALRTGRAVGTVHRLELGGLAAPGGEFSLHELGVAGVLTALRAVARDPPEIVVIGAEVGAIRAFGEGLSAPVRSAVPVAAGMVLREAGR
jgi:hydrogenase maturation protease